MESVNHFLKLFESFFSRCLSLPYALIISKFYIKYKMECCTNRDPGADCLLCAFTNKKPTSYTKAKYGALWKKTRRAIQRISHYFIFAIKNVLLSYIWTQSGANTIPFGILSMRLVAPLLWNQLPLLVLLAKWKSSLPNLKAIAYSRSEERRVGKEWLRLCRFRWSPYH